MSKRVVKFTLDAKSISKAVKEIEEYKREVLRKTNELRKRIAERIAEDASSGFASAIVDDLLPNSGGARGANVSVEVSDSGNTTLIIANGTRDLVLSSAQVFTTTAQLVHRRIRKERNLDSQSAVTGKDLGRRPYGVFTKVVS